MSQHSPSAAPQPYGVSSHSPISPELAERIRKLHEAAQDVAAFYAQAGQGSDGDSPPRSKPTGEARCYYLSAATVQHERELLRKYNATDFRSLLAETHLLLVGLVKLMKTTQHDVRMKGYVIASLGCLLEQASALILRMRNVYDRVERIS